MHYVFGSSSSSSTNLYYIHTDSSKAKNTEEVLTTHDIQIIHPSEPQQVLPPGATVFSFEMPLSVGLPESVKCPQINVEYTISAKIAYHKANTAILNNETINKPVILARLPDSGILTGENYPSTIDSLKHLDQWCQYRIVIDKKSAALGSRLPLKIQVVPTCSGLRLKQVYLQLLERRTVKQSEDEQQTTQLCHFIYPAKEFPALALPQRPLTENWFGCSEYQIPEEDKMAHSTTSYDNFHVSHILLVSLIVTIPDINSKSRYRTKTISFQTPIDLLNSHVSQLGDHCLKLPPYDHPISTEESDKLNRHGLLSPPPYHYCTMTA